MHAVHTWLRPPVNPSSAYRGACSATQPWRSMRLGAGQRGPLLTGAAVVGGTVAAVVVVSGRIVVVGVPAVMVVLGVPAR